MTSLDGPSPDVDRTLDLLFRRRSSQLTATLTRILGLDQLDVVEDVVQDAFVQALRRWPSTGVPDNPGAWVLRVAKNRAIDVLRRQGRWQDKRAELEASILPRASEGLGAGLFSGDLEDDELRMIFATCHPAIPRDSQVALTLKTVGGFGVAEIARAFLASKPTIAQRIVRAKRALRDEDIRLCLPKPEDPPEHLDAALEVIYLMFNEGHSAAAGPDLVRSDLAREAIRLAELLAHHRSTAAAHIDALVALFLFQAARLPARSGPKGELIPLAEQDRSDWDRPLMRRGLMYLQRSAQGEEITSYHLQAEIASCHTLAATYEETDWPRILGCYDRLLEIDPSPVVALNRIVALAEVEDAGTALAAVEGLSDQSSLTRYHHYYAVQAEMLARVGRLDDAQDAASKAISLVGSRPERHYLERRARSYRRQP